MDESGRAQLYNAHANRSGWFVWNTFNPDQNVQVAKRINFAEEMARAMFCYSPLGQFAGDTDRRAGPPAAAVRMSVPLRSGCALRDGTSPSRTETDVFLDRNRLKWG